MQSAYHLQWMHNDVSTSPQQSPPSQSQASWLFSSLHRPLPIHFGTPPALHSSEGVDVPSARAEAKDNNKTITIMMTRIQIPL